MATYKEIQEREDNNWNSIYLYHEGIFLKAYQHSACLLHMYQHPFKVSRKFVKSMNMHFVSVGFPKDALKKWTYNMKVVQLEDKLFQCFPEKTLTEPEYNTWLDCTPISNPERFTANTYIIEKAPVYKNAYDLLTQVMSFSVNISKNAQVPLGARLKTLCYEMCYLVRTLYEVEDKNASIDLAIGKCDEIKYILQILQDLKEISIKTFALASERTVSVSKQLTALRKGVKA